MRAELVGDLAEVLGQVGVESVEVGASGLGGEMLQVRHSLVIAGGEPVVVNLGVADGVDEHVCSLSGGDGLDLVVGAGVFFAVGEEDEHATVA